MTISWLFVSLWHQQKSAPHVCIRATTHDVTRMTNLNRERPIATECPSGFVWRTAANGQLAPPHDCEFPHTDRHFEEWRLETRV